MLTNVNCRHPIANIPRSVPAQILYGTQAGFTRYVYFYQYQVSIINVGLMGNVHKFVNITFIRIIYSDFR